MSVFRQIVCTFIISVLSISMGVVYTFPSSTYTLYEGTNTTLHRPMTKFELSLFGSLSSIGALISTPIAGFLLDIIGRKKCAILFSSSHVVAWSMILVSNRVEVLLVAVFIAGIGGAAFLVVPMYVSEVCQESIRAGMTLFSAVFYSVGVIVSYAIGGSMEYYPMVYVFLAIAVAETLMLTAMRESPLYLMLKERDKDAAKSMAFYRTRKASSAIVQEEIEKIRRTMNLNLDEDDGEFPEREEKLPVLQIIKKSYSTRRALVVTLTLVTAMFCQGLIAIEVYAEPMFSQAMPSIPATLSSVLFSVVCVVAGFIAAYLTDVTGRRPLIIYSSVGSGACCALLGSLVHARWAPDVLTALLIYAFGLTFRAGAGTVPYVLSTEVFLPEVKSLMSMVVIEWVWLCSSVVLFIFNPLVAAAGLAQVFYMFAAVCFATAAFTFFYLPETKGLPVDAIQLLFSQKKIEIVKRS